MDVSRPYLTLTSPATGAVLQVLWGTTAPLTGRQVARLARDGSQPTVQAALTFLTSHGLVDAQPAGSAVLYTLNRDHVAMAVIDELLRMHDVVIERIRQQVQQWKPAPAHLSIFGSMARGDGDPSSDIDLLVVRPRRVDLDAAAWRQQITRLEELIHRWTGNRAAPVEVSLADLAAMAASRRRLVADVERDGILIAGRALSRLVSAEDRLSRTSTGVSA